jgi:hypothetical protein
MFRKLMLSSVVALGLAVPFVAAQAVSADPIVHPHHHHYRVYSRPNCHCAWTCQGTYHHFHEAERVAHRLQRRGFETMICS